MCFSGVFVDVTLLYDMLYVNMYMYDTKMLCKQCDLFSQLLFGNIDV